MNEEKSEMKFKLKTRRDSEKKEKNTGILRRKKLLESGCRREDVQEYQKYKKVYLLQEEEDKQNNNNIRNHNCASHKNHVLVFVSRNSSSYIYQNTAEGNLFIITTSTFSMIIILECLSEFRSWKAK